MSEGVLTAGINTSSKAQGKKKGLNQLVGWLPQFKVEKCLGLTKLEQNLSCNLQLVYSHLQLEHPCLLYPQNLTLHVCGQQMETSCGAWYFYMTDNVQNDYLHLLLLLLTYKKRTGINMISLS